MTRQSTIIADVIGQCTQCISLSDTFFYGPQQVLGSLTKTTHEVYNRGFVSLKFNSNTGAIKEPY